MVGVVLDHVHAARGYNVHWNGLHELDEARRSQLVLWLLSRLDYVVRHLCALTHEPCFAHTLVLQSGWLLPRLVASALYFDHLDPGPPQAVAGDHGRLRSKWLVLVLRVAIGIGHEILDGG